MADQGAKSASEWAAMQAAAERAGDKEAATYFASKVAEQTKTKAPVVEMPEESPYSLKNMLGAATEPMLSMATGAGATIAGGLAGAGKGAVYNPLSRLFGGSPEDASSLVERIQGGGTYQPRTTGGQNAMKAFGAPSDVLSQIVPALVEQGYRDPEMASFGDTTVGTVPPLMAAGLETVVQGVPQVLGARGAGKIAPKVSPRAMLSDAVGSVSPKAGEALKRPPPDPRVKLLADKGVVTTPGQRAQLSKNPLKRNMGRVEEAVGRHPLLGGWINRARGQSVEQHARAQVNDALEIAGEKPVPKDMNIHQAVDHAQRVLEGRYSSVLGRTSGDLYMRGPPGTPGATANLVGDMSNILSEGREGLARSAEKNELGNIVLSITKKFEKDGPNMGKTSGENLKEIQKLLADKKQQFERGGGHAASLVPYIERLQKSFREMVKRSNPGAAGEIDTLDRAYAQMKMTQRASTTKAALKDSGTFSPDTMLGEVRKRALKRGAEGEKLLTRHQAQGQPLAEAGAEVLGNKLPDSGTPTGMTVQEVLAGSAGFGLGGVPGAIAGTSVPLAYSQPALRALQSAYLTGKSPAATGLAAGLPVGASNQPSPQSQEDQIRQMLAEMGVLQ